VGRVWRVVAGSFDHTTKIWEVRSGRCIHTLTGHRGEISSCSFNCTKPPRLFSSDDWRLFPSEETRDFFWSGVGGSDSAGLVGATGTGELCISGSIDRTCKIWNVASGQCISTLRGHNDEILDVAFNLTGSKLVTASADGALPADALCRCCLHPRAAAGNAVETVRRVRLFAGLPTCVQLPVLSFPPAGAGAGSVP